MTGHAPFVEVVSSWQFSPTGLVAGGVALSLATGLWMRGYRRSAAWVTAAGICVALVRCSPLGSYADGVLFSAHMIEHLELLLAVPLMLVFAAAAYRETRAQTSQSRDTNGEAYSRGRLLLGWIASLTVMWVWHQPLLCSASFTSPLLGLVRDASFVGAGCLFWRPMIGQDAVSGPAAVGYLFSACIGCTALGVYITFAPFSVCPVFHNAAHLAAERGLTRIGWSAQLDQQIGGLLMWVLPCIVYVVGSVVAIRRWYRGGYSPGAEGLDTQLPTS